MNDTVVRQIGVKIISATNVHVRCTLRKPITIRNRASKIPTKRYAMQSTFLRPRKSRKLHLGSGAFYNSQVARLLSARLLCDLHRNVRSALRPSLYSPLFTLHGFKPHRLNQLGELNRRLSMVKLEVLMRLSLLRYFQQQQQQHTKGIWRWGGALRPRCQSQRLQVQGDHMWATRHYVYGSFIFPVVGRQAGRWWWFWLVPRHLILDGDDRTTYNQQVFVVWKRAHTYTHTTAKLFSLSTVGARV